MPPRGVKDTLMAARMAPPEFGRFLAFKRAVVSRLQAESIRVDVPTPPAAALDACATEDLALHLYDLSRYAGGAGGGGQAMRALWLARTFPPPSLQEMGMQPARADDTPRADTPRAGTPRAGTPTRRPIDAARHATLTRTARSNAFVLLTARSVASGANCSVGSHA
jgi:hypothetical protein